MVTRRTVLKSGLVVGGLTVGGLSTSGSVGADASELPDDAMVVNEFDSVDYPGENELGEWSEHVAFADDELADGVLRLEYDDGGFLASNVFGDVSEYTHLALLVRGDDGGEEDDVALEIGGVRAPLTALTDDSIGTTFDTVTVDLEDAGVDADSVDDVKLNFWQGGSGAIELDCIAFVDESGGDASDIQPETTVAEFFPEYDEYTFMRAWREYMPGEAGDGYGNSTDVNRTDDEKADEFDVDLDAVQSKTADGSITFEEMGTQALDWARQFEEEGFPRRATTQLLARLSLLPDETEEMTYHDDPSAIWDQTAGPVEATNDPDQLIQEEWAPDARSYQYPGKMIRDRAHDQGTATSYETDESYWTWADPEGHDWYRPDERWTRQDQLEEDRYRDSENPIHDLADGVHPATGESLGGDGFTANAPMTAEVRMHEDGSGYWNQYLEFENTSAVPYTVDAAVIMWIGPTGANGSLRDGHYNNEQRPHAGFGHPQRDVIEVVHDEEANLSAYAVRIAQHDEPVNMRVAYPNQKWSLEIGMGARDDLWSEPEERQELVDTMLDTLHVEIETDLDRNIDLVDAVDLRNRMTN